MEAEAATTRTRTRVDVVNIVAAAPTAVGQKMGGWWLGKNSSWQSREHKLQKSRAMNRTKHN